MVKQMVATINLSLTAWLLVKHNTDNVTGPQRLHNYEKTSTKKPFVLIVTHFRRKKSSTLPSAKLRKRLQQFEGLADNPLPFLVKGNLRRGGDQLSPC